MRERGTRMSGERSRVAARGVRLARRRAAASAAAVKRTTVQLPAELHMALRRRAIDEGTTMGHLVRAAVEAGLQTPRELAAESMPYRRTTAGTRTTVDLPGGLHRALKVLACKRATTMQALVVAALLRPQASEAV